MINGLLNPATAMGVGLLSSSGPSLTPGDVSLGRGLQSGLSNLSQIEGLRLRDQLFKEKIRAARQAEALQRQQYEEERRKESMQQRAVQGLLSGIKDPSQRAQVEALIQVDRPAAIKLLTAQEDMPTSVEEYRFAVQNDGFQGSYTDWIKAKAQAGSSSVTVNPAADPWKAQTEFGKLYQEITALEAMPKTPERDRAIAAAKEKLNANPTIGAEERRSQGRMGAVSQIASDFNDLADANDKDVGPFAGRFTRGKVSTGFGSDVEGQLVSMENQMKALLGTALSGAAIPATEWPTYQAMVPSATDSKETRHAKAETYQKMIAILEQIAAGKATVEDLDATVSGSAPKAGPNRVKWGDITQ